jgi:hypothetical protein
MGEMECDFAERQVKKKSSRATNYEKQHDLTLTKWRMVAREMDGLDQQASQSKLWITGLLHQIHFMSNCSDVTTTPLPIKNPSDMHVQSFSIIHVQACPICGLFYSCNNIVVASCRCTYHPFWLGVHLDKRATHCAKPSCGEQFLINWITSYGFK